MVQYRMRKSDAIKLLGGSIAATADKVGASYQAVSKWPDDLPPRIADRVQAALYREILQPRLNQATDDVAAPQREAA